MTTEGNAGFSKGITMPCTVNIAEPPFSAIGDGLVDDTAAIQQAIDHANSAIGGN